jgi:ribosomal protein L20A (L18A)
MLTGLNINLKNQLKKPWADITPIDHSDDEDGASVEDIASAITRRMMAHPKFGALVREIDIIDLNDAIEDVAQFHRGGDLGTSDVSNMVRDVLKQLKKEGALSEEEDLAEMIGYYTIMLNGKVVARGVRATSEKDAIEQAYMKMGSASKYTGAGRDSFKAVREEQEVNEEDVEENAFNQAAAAAARAGKKEFEFGGKTHPVKMDKATAHKLDDDINEDEDSEPASPDEGGMAGDQAEFIKYAVDEIKAHIEAGGDFPEWFQNKMSDVYGKMKDLHGYMEGDKRNDADDESEEEVEFELEERKLSSSEEQEMERIVTAMKDDPETVKDMKERYGKRWKEVAYATATKMAKQHGKGTGNKKKKTESTTSGSVVASTGATGEGIYGNPSIYEGFNSRVENMITESMNVNVSSSNDPTAEPSISVSATGEDASMLAQLLKLAAVPARPQTDPVQVLR